MEKIIFLDFDGVLQIDVHTDPWLGNTTLLKGYSDRDKYGLLFDKQCVKNLEHLINVTEAAVVISSSWRFEGWEKIQEMWIARQMPGSLLGITTIDENVFSRGDEVQMWLEEYSCERYVILDDVDDFLASQQANLVLTNFKTGLKKEALKKAIDILNH